MIRGTLTEFSLPELIRLVSETHKTGVLEIAGPHGAGELLFLDGCVCGSRSDSSREPLGRKLVRAKAISERDLWTALDDQSRRHQRLGQLLIARGSVSSEQVQSALREQIEDGAVDIVTLGPTHFVWRSEPPDEPGPVLIPPESFLSGVAERVEEMEKIRERIPAQDAVVSICPIPSEETLEAGVSREEWQILSMLGTKRTVGDLMRYSGSADTRTLRALDRLMSAGLLELGDASRRPPRPPSGGTPENSAPVVEQGDRTIRLPHGPTRDVFRSGPPVAGGGEPFRLAIVATSNRPHGLLGAAVLRTLTGDLPVRIVLHRLDDLGPVAPSAEALLRAEELGVDLASYPARQLRRGELAEADLIIGLDWWHVDRAVSYGGGARKKSFTIAELLKLLESEEVAVRETRLVTKARLLVEHAHELRLAASNQERLPATPSGHDSRFSDAQSLDCWSQLARLLFSVETVEEIS
jgi:hypothetical protein